MKQSVGADNQNRQKSHRNNKSHHQLFMQISRCFHIQAQSNLYSPLPERCSKWRFDSISIASLSIQFQRYGVYWRSLQEGQDVSKQERTTFQRKKRRVLLLTYFVQKVKIFCQFFLSKAKIFNSCFHVIF